ncbi:MAG: Hsp20/alpha crystallin family protein [Candidatus Bathyarchaeia archaeon]
MTDRTDLSQLLLHPVPLGIILILAGLTLMMIGSVLTVGTGEGFLIIFPLFLGQVEPTTGMLLFFFILAITMLFVFAPWIFGPKRVEHILRAAVGSQRERGKKNELIAEKDYYISIDVSDLVRKSIAISASKHEVRVQGKMENGDPFEKDFDFPEDVRIEMVEYEYSANYLILRIKATTTP